MKIVETVTLGNELGLHARAAAKIVQVSHKYRSRISFERNGMKADGNSILDILVLACPKGSSLTIRADGIDAQEAVAELRALIDNKFGEM
jgi:phosphocarrier protein